MDWVVDCMSCFERHLIIGGIFYLLFLSTISFMSFPAYAQPQCSPDNKCCLYYNEYLKYKEILDKCKTNPSSCPSNTGWVRQQALAAHQKYVELLSQGKCGSWSPPAEEAQGGVTEKSGGVTNVTTKVTEAVGGAAPPSNDSGQEGAQQPVSNEGWDEPVTQAGEDGAMSGEGQEEGGDILVGLGFLGGMIAATGLAIRSIVRKITKGNSKQRKRKGGIVESPRMESPIEQFTKSFEDSGQRLTRNLGKLAEVGAGIDAINAVANKLVKEYIRQSGKIVPWQIKAGGLGKVKPIVISTPDPKVKFIKYSPRDSRILVARMRLRRWGKAIVKKYKFFKKVSKFTKGIGKGLSGVSRVLQVLDTISSYNEYVKKNEGFVRKHPILGRILGVSKTMGEQIITTIITKNPLVGWADTIVSSLSGGELSIMKGIKAIEGGIDKATKLGFESVFNVKSSKEFELMRKRHLKIMEHAKRLRDPKFVKKLKSRGWTDEQIRKARIRILGQISQVGG